jgi:hypothetical protein
VLGLQQGEGHSEETIMLTWLKHTSSYRQALSRGCLLLGQGLQEPPAVLYCMTRHLTHRSRTALPPVTAAAA